MQQTDHASASVMEPPPKPRLRGRFHQVAFIVSIPAGYLLVLAAPTTAARVAAAIYALSLAGLYGTSAAYHRLRWSPRGLRWMQRLDHSMIFVLIAGTYTPFSILVLGGAWRVVTLSVVWAGALVGILLKMIRIDRTRVLSSVLYITLGWFAIIAMPQIVKGLSGPAIGLLFAGGLLYTAGSIVLARRRPNPSPKNFGYHEVWHSFVVAASLCHYAVILLVLIAIR